MNKGRRLAIKTLAGGLAGALTLPVLRTNAGTEAIRNKRKGQGIANHSVGKLTDLTATDAVYLMRSGRLSAESYVSALIEAFDRHRNLNAIISRDDDRLLEAARAADRRLGKGYAPGPLHGLPVLLKDNIETAALPSSAGTPALRGRQTYRDAAVARLLFDAGALLAGKSNMNELAAGGDKSCIIGQAQNPYDNRLRPGGSSTGNGAALAARLVPAAIGTDTGGSVRTPAALCGCTALRPTFGRYSGYGIMPISVSRDTPGPMARTVTDLALLDGVIAGCAPGLQPADLRGVRIGIARDYFYSVVDADVAPVIDAALDILSELGAELVEAGIPDLETRMTGLRGLFVRSEFGRDVPGYLLESGQDITVADLVEAICNPEIRRLFENTPDRRVRAGAQQEVDQLRRALRRDYYHYFMANRLEAMVFPATVLPARPFGDRLEVRVSGRTVPVSYSRNFMPGSTIGLPGISVPAGLTRGGLPVGLGLDGPHGSDRRLLAISAAFEQARPPLPPPPLAG